MREDRERSLASGLSLTLLNTVVRHRSLTRIRILISVVLMRFKLFELLPPFLQIFWGRVKPKKALFSTTI